MINDNTKPRCSVSELFQFSSLELYSEFILFELNLPLGYNFRKVKRKKLKMPLAIDFLHPTPAEEKRKHKLKRLVPHPNSYFMDVKCPGCYKITTMFSHAQDKVKCEGCSQRLCRPSGGKAILTEGCSFRRKQY